MDVVPRTQWGLHISHIAFLPQRCPIQVSSGRGRSSQIFEERRSEPISPTPSTLPPPPPLLLSYSSMQSLRVSLSDATPHSHRPVGESLCEWCSASRKTVQECLREEIPFVTTTGPTSPLPHDTTRAIRCVPMRAMTCPTPRTTHSHLRHIANRDNPPSASSPLVPLQVFGVPSIMHIFHISPHTASI